MSTCSALPMFSFFPWQSAWGNVVDSSVLPLFICLYLRSKRLWYVLMFAYSIFVSDLSLPLSMLLPSCDGPLPRRGKSLWIVQLPGKWWGSDTAQPRCLGAKEGWHLGLQAQAHALTSESKGIQVVLCFLLSWWQERVSDKVQQSRQAQTFV